MRDTLIHINTYTIHSYLYLLAEFRLLSPYPSSAWLKPIVLVPIHIPFYGAATCSVFGFGLCFVLVFQLLLLLALPLVLRLFWYPLLPLATWHENPCWKYFVVIIFSQCKQIHAVMRLRAEDYSWKSGRVDREEAPNFLHRICSKAIYIRTYLSTLRKKLMGNSVFSGLQNGLFSKIFLLLKGHK